MGFTATWLIVVGIALLILVFWGKPAYRFFTGADNDAEGELNLKYACRVYTAQTVTDVGLHHICINGRIRQTFHVSQVIGAWFHIKVFPYGDQGIDLAQEPFEGWATELRSDRLIDPSDLLEHPRTALT